MVINNKRMDTQIPYEWGNQIKAEGTEGACRKYGTEDIYIYMCVCVCAGIWKGNLQKTGNLEEREHRLDSSGSG